jgi:hypothetical protein
MSITNEPNARSPSLDIPGRAKRHRRRWWRWPLRVFLLLLVGATLRVWFYAHRHREAVAGVREAVAELDRTEPGWRLQDIEAARAAIPDAENSALVVSAVHQLVPRDWTPRELAVRFEDVSPEVRLDDDTNDWLRDELCQTQDALLEARKLSDLPNGRHSITFPRNPLDTLLPHVDYTCQVFALLQLDMLAQGEQGDLKVALRSCRALLNAARSLGDEPLMVTQLVRMAGVLIACKAVERVLAQGEPDPDDLFELQKVFEAEERFPRLVVSTRGERAINHELLDAIECGHVSLAEVAGSRPSWWERLTGFAVRDYVRTQHPEFLALMTELVRIAGLPPEERDAPLQVCESKVRSHPRGSLATLFLPAMPKFHDWARRTDAHLRCAMAALAAERYRRHHGRFPETLEQLVPDFLPAVPLDPKDGQPMGYQRLDDRVVIYSLCQGGSKSGMLATYDPDEPSPPGEGVAFHLFDVKHRRQPFAELLPPPAIDDEPQQRGIDP